MNLRTASGVGKEVLVAAGGVACDEFKSLEYSSCVVIRVFFVAAFSPRMKEDAMF